MPKSTATCSSILALIFNGTAWADIAENDSSGPLANLYLALYTDVPDTAGDDCTVNEVSAVAYVGYARKVTTRNTNALTGWDAPSAGATKNAGLLQFPECTGGAGVHVSHVAIVTTALGAGKILYSGELTAHRDISNGIQPQFADEALVITET
jgi:hypothetical protein